MPLETGGLRAVRPLILVVQARTSSRRLPGKVLRDLGGRPMIAHVLARAARVRGIDGVTLATSSEDSDTPLAETARGLGVPVHRGSLDNVADRVVSAAEALGARSFVRVSGDSPFLAPEVVADVVDRFLSEPSDLASNVVERTFPKGMSCEVLDVAAFRAALPEFRAPEDHEHVTPYFYRHAQQFRIASVTRRPPIGDVNLSVDTPEDFALAERLDRRLREDGLGDGLDAVLQALKTETGVDLVDTRAPT